jgi:predicted PhzF superfamily epimerase YddE/YHI9
MSQVARESGQPTTSFVDERASSFRTFGANGVELPTLSGHSSLGIAAALSARTGGSSAVQQHCLQSKYGEVTLTHDGEMFEVAFPAACSGSAVVEPAPLAPLVQALNADEGAVLSHGSLLGGAFLFVELTPAGLAEIRPNTDLIRELPAHSLIAMAEGMVSQQCGYVPDCVANAGATPQQQDVDFTVRNFVPKFGIDEDIATGSIQVGLNPFWSAKLGRAEGEPLLCLQASRRGGFVRSRSPGDGFVHVAGHTALSFSGQMPFSAV